MITLRQQRELGELLGKVGDDVDAAKELAAKELAGAADAGPLNDAVDRLADAVIDLRRVVSGLLNSQEIAS